MNLLVMVLGCALALASTACVGARPTPPAEERVERAMGSGAVVPGSQRAQRLEREVVRRVEANYLLHLPRGYGEEPDRRWPLILYLHGGSMRGEDVERLRAAGLPRRVEQEPGFPFIVLSPQAAAGTLWTDTELLVALLDEVGRTYAVDPERVYLVGHSMGGNGAWFLAYQHPERFAALIAGSAPANPWWATRLASLPTLVFHGDRDEVVPPRESQVMVEALRARGGDVTFLLLEGRDHFVLDVLEDLSLYEWLLKHRRTDLPAAAGVAEK